jgi:peptidoglycan hydrolase CwlO-like protein
MRAKSMDVQRIRDQLAMLGDKEAIEASYEDIRKDLNEAMEELIGSLKTVGAVYQAHLSFLLAEYDSVVFERDDYKAKWMVLQQEVEKLQSHIEEQSDLLREQGIILEGA